MISTNSFVNYIAMMLAVTLLLLFSGHATRAETKLPNHVLEQFGTPPSFPTGPLSEAMQFNVRTVFKESLADVSSVSQSIWGEAQSIALSELWKNYTSSIFHSSSFSLPL